MIHTPVIISKYPRQTFPCDILVPGTKYTPGTYLYTRYHIQARPKYDTACVRTYAFQGFVLYLVVFFQGCVLQGTYRTIPGVFSWALPVPRTSVRSVQYDIHIGTRKFCKCVHDIHTRTRNFYKICSPVRQYPGDGYNMFIPARNCCGLCTPVPQFLERVCLL